MANGFANTTEKVEERLRLHAELVLIRLAEVPSIERREVGIWVKGGQDEAAFGMYGPVPIPKRGQRGGDVGQGKIAHQAIEGGGLKRNGFSPIGLHPSDGDRRHRGQPADKSGSEFPLQRMNGMASTSDRITRASHSDHERGWFAGPTGMSCTVGVIDQRGARQIALSGPCIDKDGPRVERAHEAIQIVKQLSVFVEVPQLGELRQVSRAQRVPADL